MYQLVLFLTPNKVVENSIYISKAVLDFCHVLSVGI